jgi:hypothetical protein
MNIKNKKMLGMGGGGGGWYKVVGFMGKKWIKKRWAISKNQMPIGAGVSFLKMPHLL